MVGFHVRLGPPQQIRTRRFGGAPQPIATKSAVGKQHHPRLEAFDQLDSHRVLTSAIRANHRIEHRLQGAAIVGDRFPPTTRWRACCR